MTFLRTTHDYRLEFTTLWPPGNSQCTSFHALGC
jgi:hypothetical protein